MKNKIFTAIFTLLLFLPIKIYAEPLEPTINNATPKIKLENPSVVNLNAGGNKDIELTIRNVGVAAAYNILTQATIDSSAPFTISFVNDSNAVPVISATGKKIMKLNVKADKNAKSGTYTVSLTHSFTNDVNTNFTESDTFAIKIKNENSAPLINITNFTNTNAKILPGDQFSLTAIIENASAQNAYDLQVSIEGIKTDEINLANSTMGTYFPNFSAGMQKYLNFDFVASSKIQSGSYPLTFKVSYKDGDEKVYDKSFFYYVNIAGQTQFDKSQPELTDIIVPTKTFNVGETATVSMKLKNPGQTNLKNVKVTAITDEDGAIVPKTPNIIFTQLLKPNEAKSLTFAFAPTSKAKTQNYSIKFQVEYENVDKNSFEQYIGINVNNPESEASDSQSKPKIIVQNYSTNPMIVTAGSEFDLSMTFKNTHKNKRVENTKISLTIDEAATSTNEQKGNVFTPVNGSTTFFIGDIAPSDKIEKKLRLYTLPTATPKNYSVVVNFEYEDEKHNEIKSSETIGISVKQPTKLDTSEINIPSEIYVNQPTAIAFDFYNTGKVNLNNLLIKIEGEDFDTKQSAIFYGKFNTSTSDTYEGNFTPLQPGEKSGRIIISYEDDAGETKEQIKNFTVNVQESMPIDDNFTPDTPPIEEPKKSWWKNPYIWGAIIISVGVAIFIVKKIRQKKKGNDLDE